MKRITSKRKFKKAFGFRPVQDDMDRANCKQDGSCHWSCGVCPEHKMPRYKCHCLNYSKRELEIKEIEEQIRENWRELRKASKNPALAKLAGMLQRATEQLEAKLESLTSSY